MAGIVIGFKCPQCGYDGGRESAPTIMLEMHLFNGQPIAQDLECGACHFQWRYFFPE